MKRRDFLKLSSALPAAALSNFDIDVSDLDPSKKYLVIVKVDDDYTFMPDDKDQVEHEIEHAFEQVGISQHNIGIVFLHGLEMEIVSVP